MEEYDLEVRICEDGKMSDGNPCTGSAHRAGKHIKCTDPSHVLKMENGLIVDGLYVPPHGLYDIRDFKWGVRR